jgi:poly(3-hydroxybutyrate) depolymerase
LPLAASAAGPLPRFNVDREHLTVSGVSSGGYMAVQVQVAHSSRFIGAGIIAGGPYYCAETTLAIALTRCMRPDPADEPDPARLTWLTRQFAEQDRIDPVEGLADDHVWMFSSPDDTVVRQRVSDRLFDYYLAFVDPARITYVNRVRGEHSMPTRDFGFPCDYKGSSANPDDHFINDCDYDAAGELLTHLLRRVRTPAATPTGQVLAFDQSAYIDNPTAHGMGATGYLYVPQTCANGAHCRVHVVFHGCLQGASRIGETFVRHAGYNRWADSNRVIVLYPQATASPSQGNGNGCWDWWGYDDARYATRDGRQVAAVMRMVDALGGAADHEPDPPAPSGLQAELQLDGSLALQWQPVEDPRIVGYTVFRADVAAGPYVQVGADLITTPSLTLASPGAGTQHYTVVAVTTAGLESVAAPAVVVSVPGL